MCIGCVGIDLYRSRKGAGTFSATPPPCTSERAGQAAHTRASVPRRPRRGQIIAGPGAGANIERTQKPHNSLENHNSSATIYCAADSLPVPFGPDKLRPAGRESRCWLLTWHRGLLTLVFLKVNNVLFVCLFLLLPCALCQLQRLRISAADKAPVSRRPTGQKEAADQPGRRRRNFFLCINIFIYLYFFLFFLIKGVIGGRESFFAINALLNQIHC